MVAQQRKTETSLSELLKATVMGGLLFLLPLILVVILVTHAMQLAGKVAHPVSEVLTLDKVIGPTGEQILAVLMLVLFPLRPVLLHAQRLAGRSCADPSTRSWADSRNIA